MLSIQTKTKQKIGSKEYDISYPNVGQTLEIENFKLLLSGNSYGELVKSSHKTATDLLNLIDGVSYFTVLIPEFKNDFNIDKFTEMEITQRNQITRAFITFWKWLTDIETELNKPEPQAPTEDESQENE